MKPSSMTTLTEILEKFKNKKWDNEIKLNDANEMQNMHNKKLYSPTDLVIIKTYRFEGDSDPADNVALYLIKDKQDNICYMMDAYGAYSDKTGAKFDEFLKLIEVDESQYPNEN